MEPVFIYITTKDKNEAKKIAKHLLEQKLIVCANFFPINSVCWWEGKIEENNEFVLILKTKEENYHQIKKEIEKIHSYDVPCITRIKVEPNTKYLSWMEKQFKLTPKSL